MPWHKHFAALVYISFTMWHWVGKVYVSIVAQVDILVYIGSANELQIFGAKLSSETVQFNLK